jgi:sec-independent protein translocase protein TatA
MGTFSIWHWLIVLAVVLILFGGRGKVSQLMGDFGKGLKAFKKGMGDEDTAAQGDDPKSLPSDSPAGSAGETRKDKAASG